MSAATQAGMPVLWAAAVVVAAWRYRPRSGRLRDMGQVPGAIKVGSGPLGRLGALLKQAAGVPAHAVSDRRIGWTVAGAGIALFVSPMIAMAVVALSAGTAVLVPGRRRRAEQGVVAATLPDVIDLFLLAAGAGHPVQRSVQLVAARSAGPVGQALQTASRQIDHGLRTADALESAASELGEAVRPLVGVLCASERYGTPLVPALDRLAVESRNDRRRRAEEAARRVPVKMLFPLVLCTLPAFALLTVVPLLIGAFGSLRL